MLIPDDDEIRFKSIINLLKHTPKVYAPPGFEAALMRRINSNNYNVVEKISWWENILLPARIIPSIGALVAVIFFFVININSSEPENPFLITPKIREKLNSDNNIQIQDISKQNPNLNEASLNQSFAINKEGLNFLQIRLTNADRIRINNLKSQIREYFKENLTKDR